MNTRSTPALSTHIVRDRVATSGNEQIQGRARRTVSQTDHATQKQQRHSAYYAAATMRANQEEGHRSRAVRPQSNLEQNVTPISARARQAFERRHVPHTAERPSSQHQAHEIVKRSGGSAHLHADAYLCSSSLKSPRGAVDVTSSLPCPAASSDFLPFCNQAGRFEHCTALYH